MWDKFGEFDSVEELNRAAAAQREEGDEEALVALAVENGLEKEDAEDYMDGVAEELATAIMAAIGKLQVESRELELKGIVEEWKDLIVQECMESEELSRAVRRKKKSLPECMAALLKYSFENKVQVSNQIADITKVIHNGRLEPMRKPVYMGVPGRADARKIIREYYLG